VPVAAALRPHRAVTRLSMKEIFCSCGITFMNVGWGKMAQIVSLALPGEVILSHFKLLLRNNSYKI
jgi:hypothetical protein